MSSTRRPKTPTPELEPVEAEFPVNGSWSDQKDYVDNLPRSVIPKKLDEALAVAKNHKSVFNVQSNDVPAGVQLNLYTHTLQLAGNNENTDSDNDEEGEDITALYQRNLTINNQTRTDKARLLLPDSNQTLTMKYNEDGSVKTIKRLNKPFSAFESGLTTFDPNNKATSNSVSVVAAASNEECTAYSTFRK